MWLGLDPGDQNALELLGRSGGMRATDALHVFPCSDPTPENADVVEFFSRGFPQPLESTDRVRRVG